MGELINLDGKPLLPEDKAKAEAYLQRQLLIDQLKSTIELAIDSAKQKWNKQYKDEKISIFIKGGVVPSKLKAFLQLHLKYDGSEYVVFREERRFVEKADIDLTQHEWEYELLLAFVRSMILGSIDSFVLRMQIQRTYEEEEARISLLQPGSPDSDSQPVA